MLVWPLLPVGAMLPKVAEGFDDAGAVDVTVALGTGLPYWSFTTTTSGNANAVFTVAL